MKHQLDTVKQGLYGSYVASCICGERFTGPDRFIEPDLDKRKDAAWAALADHVMPEIEQALTED